MLLRKILASHLAGRAEGISGTVTIKCRGDPWSGFSDDELASEPIIWLMPLKLGDEAPPTQSDIYRKPLKQGMVADSQSTP